MKKVTNKKMTIDDLAVMVAKGFDAVYKKFDEVDSKFDEVKDRLEKVEENLASTRRDILSMGDRFTMKFEFHELANRVGLLEQKRKVKR